MSLIRMDNIAIFLDEYLNKIGSKKFESTDEFLTYKKGTFNIRLDAFLYRDGNTTYYAYIYPSDEKLLIDVKINPIDEKDLKGKDGKKLLSFTGRIEKIKEKVEKGDLKLIVGESIIGQLARIAVLGLKNNWVLIIVIAVSVGIGFFGAGYTLGNNNGLATAQNLINATIHANATPPPIVVP